MKTVRQVLGIVLAVMLSAPAAWAQQSHVVSTATLDQAVQHRVSQEQADRTALRDFLRQPAVKDMAARAGLSTEQAEAAVSALHGRDLANAATQARTVNAELAGGANTIVISTTTIIIALLVVILIIAIAK